MKPKPPKRKDPKPNISIGKTTVTSPGPIINGVPHDWVNITIQLKGYPIGEVKEIKYIKP